jgi:hypothetical protein
MCFSFFFSSFQAFRSRDRVPAVGANLYLFLPRRISAAFRVFLLPHEDRFLDLDQNFGYGPFHKLAALENTCLLFDLGGTIGSPDYHRSTGGIKSLRKPWIFLGNF